MSDLVSVLINGERRTVPAGANVTRMLAHLGLTAGRVAIERNLEILSREKWDTVVVAAGDRYEIVHLVGGG